MKTIDSCLKLKKKKKLAELIELVNQSLVTPALKALVLIKFQAISILLTTVDDYETNELEILK